MMEMGSPTDYRSTGMAGLSTTTGRPSVMLDRKAAVVPCLYMGPLRSLLNSASCTLDT